MPNRSGGARIAEAALASRDSAAATSALDELEAIYQTAPIGFALIDADLRFLRVNDALAEINGLPAADHIGRTLREVVPDVADKTEATFRSVFETGQPVTGIELQGETPKAPGVRRTWMENIGPIRNPDGTIRSALVTVQEITERTMAEERLRESEARYRSLFEQAAVGVGYAGPDGRWVMVNRRFAEIVGYAPDELIGHSFAAMTHPDDLAEDLVLAPALDAGTIPSIERDKRYIRKDGSEVWVHITVSLLRDAQGAPKHRVVIVQDISERKRAEAEQHAAEQRLAHALDAAAMVDFEVDFGTGAITASPRFNLLFGLPADEKPTLATVRSRYHPEDVARAAEATEAQKSANAPVAQNEFRVVMPDGSTRWVAVRGEFVPDALGRRTRGIGVAMDITDRRRAEDELRRSEERFRLAQEAASVGTYDWDVQRGQIVWSPGMYRLHGIDPATPADRLYEAWLDRLYPDDRERADRETRGFLERGGPVEIEFRIILPDGSVRWIHGRGTMERDSAGRPVRMVGVNIDVTDRKRAEERQRFLVAELSHRVKNTLAAIQSIANQTLRGNQPNAARVAFLARLHALAQAHGLLSRTDWQGADLAEVLRLELLPHAGAAERRVLFDGPSVQVGPRMALTLGMAFHELATNAAKYGALATNEGRVKIRWTIRREGDRRTLSIEWIETGGPPVRPPARKGFGSVLIDRSIEHELDGEVSMTFAPEGLRCAIEVALVT